jgi:hypothetical protein
MSLRGRVLRPKQSPRARRLLPEGRSDVRIEWNGRKMGVPLAQLKPLKTDKETKQAIEDWQYWKARGYEF